MVADERLRQPDVVDELGDRRLALGEPAHDAQAVHVGEGLVEGAQLAQVSGWRTIDAMVERIRAGVGTGGAVSWVRLGTGRRINDG